MDPISCSNMRAIMTVIDIVVDLGQTSDRGQPLYNGQVSGAQCVLYMEAPLYSHSACTSPTHSQYSGAVMPSFRCLGARA